MPDFSAFDIKTEVVHGLPVSPVLAATAGYGFAYITALLVVSVLSLCAAGFLRRPGAPGWRERRWRWRRSPWPSRCRASCPRSRLLARGSANRAFLYVQSPAVLRRIVLSFDALAADVYWIRALQHYGGDRLSRDGRERYRLLYPLLDLTTSLDPYFTIATLRRDLPERRLPGRAWAA